MRHTDSYESVETTLLSEYDDGGLFEFVVSGGCPAYRLAELGALPKTVDGVDGRGRIVAEIPLRYDPPAVTEQFLEEHPDFELIAKRTKETHASMVTRSTVQQPILDTLTQRQQEILQTAFEMGYYEWPRDCTGQDVANEFGITSATFSEHIFAAERKILTFMFRLHEASHSWRDLTVIRRPFKPPPPLLSAVLPLLSAVSFGGDSDPPGCIDGNGTSLVSESYTASRELMRRSDEPVEGVRIDRVVEGPQIGRIGIDSLRHGLHDTGGRRCIGFTGNLRNVRVRRDRGTQAVIVLSGGIWLGHG